jgi:hypothetical protein
LVSGQKPTNELSIEESLRQTISLYFNNFLTFFVPLLVATLVSEGTSTILSGYFSLGEFPEVGAGVEAWNLFFSKIETLIIAALATFVISLVASAIAEGFCIRKASELIEKGTTSTKDALNLTLRRLLPLLATTMLIAIVVGAGLAALIVPGIILAIMFSLMIPLIIIEDAKVSDSLSKSQKLVSNRWLKTFGFYAAIAVIFLFVVMVAVFISAPFGVFGSLAKSIVMSIIAAVAAPLVPIALTVHYYSMKAKERERILLPPPPMF